ncbi:ankyrin repeat domain-containing protein 11 [Discoglossus pictus]
MPKGGCSKTPQPEDFSLSYDMVEKQTGKKDKEKVSLNKTPKLERSDGAKEVKEKTTKRKLPFSVGTNGDQKDSDTEKQAPERKRIKKEPANRKSGLLFGLGLSGIRAGYPLSERQQVALLMQMTAEESANSPVDTTPKHPSQSAVGQKGTPNSASKTKDKVNKRNERGETRLHRAAIRGDARRIKELINEGADVNVKDFAGWTALHEACNRGYYDVAKQLLAAGAEVNTKGLDDDTPLHDASNNGHYKVVKLLLRYGGNPHQSNRKGETPLKVANSPTMVNLLLGKGTYTSSEESSTESSEEEDAPSFAPSSSVDGNNTDSEFEKGTKHKGKHQGPPKNTTPVKDEYEFDEDDEEDRVPPVDDKHLLKKDFKKELKANNFSITKMEVKTYSKNSAPKKAARRILSDTSDEEDNTIIPVGDGEKIRLSAHTVLPSNKAREKPVAKHKEKSKVKKKRKKDTKNKEVKLGKKKIIVCSSESESENLESDGENDRISLEISNCVKDSALVLKENSLFSSLSISSASSQGSLASQKHNANIPDQHSKHWRTDNWKTVSSPTWSYLSSSDSARTRASSESDYTSEDSSMESVKQVKKKSEHKKKSNMHNSIFEKNSFHPHVEGAIPKLDKEGKVVKKHKTKHKPKTKEKGPNQTGQDIKVLKCFSFEYGDFKQKSDKTLILESDVPEKLRVLKPDHEHLRKEDKLSKVKSEDKDWSFRDDGVKNIKEEKSAKKSKDVKDTIKSSKEDRDRTNKTEREKTVKEKSPKDEKPKTHKEEKKKKSKDKSSKSEKKNDLKEEKSSKNDKDKNVKDEKEKTKKEKVQKEEPSYEEYNNKNQFLDENSKYSMSDDEHDMWFSELSSGSSFDFKAEDSWDALVPEYKENKNDSVKLIVETVKEETKEKDTKSKDKRDYGEKLNDKEAIIKKDKEFADKKKDQTDKHKGTPTYGTEREKKRKESVDCSKNRKESSDSTRRDSLGSKERKDKIKQEDQYIDDMKDYGNEPYFKEKTEQDLMPKNSETRERHHSGKEKDKRDTSEREKKEKPPKAEKHREKPKDTEKERAEKTTSDKSQKDKEIEKGSREKKDAKEKHKDSHKERKTSLDQKTDKKEKNIPIEKDFLDKREEKKTKAKNWYNIADIFTDESEEEEERYITSYKTADSFGGELNRTDSYHEKESIISDKELSQSDKHRKYSNDKQHSGEKQKDREPKKKEKGQPDAVKEKKDKNTMEKHKEKKDKDSLEKHRKDRVSLDSNQDKKCKKGQPEKADKKPLTEEKSKSKHKDKSDKDHFKERKSSKGEAEKSLLEKLEEEALNDYKDDSNDKISEISSDSFTDRGQDPSLGNMFEGANLSSTDALEEKFKDSVPLLCLAEKLKDKERNRHSSSSSSKKSHEKDKLRKDKSEKKSDKLEDKDSYNRGVSVPYEQEPTVPDGDTFVSFSVKTETEEESDRNMDYLFPSEKEKFESDRESSKKLDRDKGYNANSSTVKEKKKKDKHREKSKEEKEKHRDKQLEAFFKQHRDDQKSVTREREAPQVIHLKEKPKEEVSKLGENKQKERVKETLDKEKADTVKISNGNERIGISKDNKKDSRPREKLLGDGDLMMTSFERMLSQKDVEIEEKHKRHKERMKQMEKMRHRSGDPKLKDKTKSSEDLRKKSLDLTSKKLSQVDSQQKEKKPKDVVSLNITLPENKSQPAVGNDSKDWLNGPQIKDVLTASPRPDQSRPTGVPTPTSVISCPSYEEVMQTPRTPSCSTEDYPDLIFDCSDTPHLPVSAMSMNACSPSFFDRFSNSSSGITENPSQTPTRSVFSSNRSRSVSVDIRRVPEDEFPSGEIKFFRQQSVPASSSFNSPVQLLIDDKVQLPLDPAEKFPCLSPGYYSPEYRTGVEDMVNCATGDIGNIASSPEHVYPSIQAKSFPLERDDLLEPSTYSADPPDLNLHSDSEAQQATESILPREQSFSPPPPPNFIPQESSFVESENHFLQNENSFSAEPDLIPEESTFLPQEPDFMPQQPDFLPQEPEFLPSEPAYLPPEPNFTLNSEPDFAPNEPAYIPPETSLCSPCTESLLPTEPSFLASHAEPGFTPPTEENTFGSTISEHSLGWATPPTRSSETVMPTNLINNSSEHTGSWSIASELLKSPQRFPESPKHFCSPEKAIATSVPYISSDSPYPVSPISYPMSEPVPGELKEKTDDNMPNSVDQTSYMSPTPLTSFFDNCKSLAEEPQELSSGNLCLPPEAQTEAMVSVKSNYLEASEDHTPHHEPEAWSDPFSTAVDDLDLGPFSLPDLPLPVKEDTDSEMNDRQNIMADSSPVSTDVDTSGGTHEMSPVATEHKEPNTPKEPSSMIVEDHLSPLREEKEDLTEITSDEDVNAPKNNLCTDFESLSFPPPFTQLPSPKHMETDEVQSNPSTTDSFGQDCLAASETTDQKMTQEIPTIENADLNSPDQSVTTQVHTSIEIPEQPTKAIVVDVPKPPKVEEIPQRMTRNRAQMLANQNKQNASPAEKDLSAVTTPTTRAKGRVTEEEDSQTQHPRKRKLQKPNQLQQQISNTHQQTREMIQQTLAAIVDAIKLDDIEPYHSDRANPYFEYLQIRKKIEEKRKILCYITPQAPQCYAEYVTYTGSYLLDGKPLSKLHIPVIAPPPSLSEPLKELFKQQEAVRGKLRLQHSIERVRMEITGCRSVQDTNMESSGTIRICKHFT